MVSNIIYSEKSLICNRHCLGSSVLREGKGQVTECRLLGWDVQMRGLGIKPLLPVRLGLISTY